MKRFAMLLLPATLLTAGCIDFTGSTRHDQPAKPAVEEVKIAPPPARKQDVDPSNPRAAMDKLERELDWDQNDAASRAPLPAAPGRWEFNGAGKQ